jgi:hypothetical protein
MLAHAAITSIAGSASIYCCNARAQRPTLTSCERRLSKPLLLRAVTAKYHLIPVARSARTTDVTPGFGTETIWLY